MREFADIATAVITTENNMKQIELHIADIIEDDIKEQGENFKTRKNLEELAKAIVSAVEEDQKEEWDYRNRR